MRTTVYDCVVQATPTCAENKISKVLFSHIRHAFELCENLHHSKISHYTVCKNLRLRQKMAESVKFTSAQVLGEFAPTNQITVFVIQLLSKVNL